jgi:uncharacterized iron-regulated membrane protein
MSYMKKITRIAFALHSWLGLVSDIFLLLLGLSGSALVFMKEIDEQINAERLQVKPVGGALPLDQLYRQIANRHPNLAGIAWLNPDAPANRAWEFRLYQNDGKISTYDLGLITINPYTGEVIREGRLRDLNPSLMHWMVQFHWSFQLGIPGLLLTTIFGITMLLSMITGIIIYRKFVWRVLLFRVPIKGNNWRTISSGLHRVIGVWTLVFNVIIFFTGFWMNMFSMDPAYWKRQMTPAAANMRSTHSMDELLKVARAEMPGLMIRNIYLPTQPGKDFRISGMLKGEPELFHNGNAVAVDPSSAKVTSLQRFKDLGFWAKVESSFMPLHTGSFGNTAVKIFYVILGLLPGLMSITGALLFFRGRLKRQTIDTSKLSG